MENFSLEHEMAVIGTALLSNNAARDMVKVVGPHHFTRYAHQAIWAALIDMVTEKIPTDDFVVLKNYLARHKTKGGGNLLEACGGEDYMLEMATFTPSPANAMHYAQTIIDLSVRRAYVNLGKDASEGKDLDTLRENAKIIGEQGDITAVHEGFTVGKIGRGQVTKGITTGFKGIDGIVLGGGWVRGQQSTVAARQKGGKSSWLVASAFAASNAAYNVVYATFADLSAQNIDEKLMKQLTGFSHEPAKAADAESWHFERGELSSQGITVYDPRKMGLGRDLETFERWLRARHKRNPVDLVLMDYAQKLWMQAVPRHEAYRQAEACSDFIDDMARVFNIAFVVGSQITLHGDGNQEMTKGSRVWEENTALLVKPKIIQPDDLKNIEEPYRTMKGITRIEIPLNRFGPAGTVWATWNDKRVMFEEVV